MQLSFGTERVAPGRVQGPFELRDVFSRFRRQSVGAGFGFSHCDAAGGHTR